MSHSNAVGFAFCLLVVLANPSVCQENQTAPTEPSWHDLNVKHAKTQLALAKVELLSAMEINRESPGTIAQLVIERLHSDVAIAEQRFQEAELATVGGSERIRLRNAEEKIRLAKLKFENGRKLHDNGMVNELELERLKLKYELAQLSLVLLKNPQYFTTMLQSLDAKVDRLGDEILSLDQRLSRLEPIRGFIPAN
ncbi:hypothetical protein NZK35_12650 [Stieleria sp. ICT_E10.1]|uniref:hypothetical protein n=1 Tax=Stieleria sedimenti TaxID=2976331 RepID=UPI00217FCBC2|nr:hypothetical protein [Stieleria sedimenti]MCS7467495.1 hypothetical protein [Stieleria sedimenti]